jgi:choice-of-anchor A domain-containing protein
VGDLNLFANCKEQKMSKMRVWLCGLSTLMLAGISRGAIFTSYNVVVTGNFTDQSHVQGTTFVNNLNAVNDPDFAQSAAAGTGDTLTVAGSITGSTVTLERGVYRYFQAATPPAVLNGGSTEVQDSSVSIANLTSQLAAASNYYASLPSTTVLPSGNNLNLTAAGSGATVFNEPGTDLNGSNENITITAAAGQSVIIVVPDGSFTFGSSNHITLGGSTSGDQIMWEFPSASTLTFNDSQWIGSILAPSASLTDNSQNINGGVYVANFNQTAEVHLSDPNLTVGQPMFFGPTPAVPEPASLALLAFGSLLLVRPKWLKDRH